LPAVTLNVRTATGKADMKQFIELPYRLHGGEAEWVPPLRFERKEFLDRKKNPYFEHAEGEYFVAERDGRVVGRITAMVDPRWDEYQGGSDGMFGFIEFEDDAEVVAALMKAAEDWVRAKGKQRLIGPMDFTMNDEAGLLIDGFDQPAIVLEPWHPPYYSRQLDALGYGKAMDLLIWRLYFGELAEGDAFTPMIHSAAEHSRKEGVIVRQMRRRDLENEVRRFMDVYNEAWGKNWGFVPITEAEVKFQAKNLKPVLDEHWAMIAELDGKVVGAALTLPDVNQALKKMNGKLFPVGWWHFLRRKKYIDRLRVFALGVKSDYQHLGVAAALYERHLEMAQDPGPSGGHMGWILESNKAMNRALEGMGGTVVKTYRIYEKAL
jgi:GNAT superfamily N-acetyltransferase